MTDATSPPDSSRSPDPAAEGPAPPAADLAAGAAASDADPAAPAEAAAVRTITIGFWPGLVALLALAGLGAWWLLAPLRAPPAGSGPPAPAGAAMPAAGGPVASLGVVQSDDGELAPGTVLEVADPGHPLANASAPDIAGSLLDGSPARLADYRGRPVLVNFWATWCPPCRLEMPWLEEAYRARRDQGLVLLAVNAGERVAPDLAVAKVRQLIQGAGYSFPVLLPEDPERAQRDYQAFGLPATYLVDPEGRVREVVSGAFPNRATLNARLDALLGPPPAR